MTMMIKLKVFAGIGVIELVKCTLSFQFWTGKLISLNASPLSSNRFKVRDVK